MAQIPWWSVKYEALLELYHPERMKGNNPKSPYPINDGAQPHVRCSGKAARRTTECIGATLFSAVAAMFRFGAPHPSFFALDMSPTSTISAPRIYKLTQFHKLTLPRFHARSNSSPNPPITYQGLPISSYTCLVAFFRSNRAIHKYVESSCTWKGSLCQRTVNSDP